MLTALAGVAQNYEGKGLSVMFGWPGDLPQGAQPRLLGVTYRMAAHQDGCILNFCPWCGADIRFDEFEKQ